MNIHYSAATTSKMAFKAGQTVKIIDGQFKGQTFTVKTVQIATVTVIRDTTKPSSFYNTITIPTSKVAKG